MNSIGATRSREQNGGSISVQFVIDKQRHFRQTVDRIAADCCGQRRFVDIDRKPGRAAWLKNDRNRARRSRR